MDQRAGLRVGGDLPASRNGRRLVYTRIAESGNGNGRGETRECICARLCDGQPGRANAYTAEMQKMADTQAAPLIEKLKADPPTKQLLESIGNVYDDAQQYPVAIEYYKRALQVQPANANVRTDMATAYWYTGDADTAIAEFQKSLTYEPNKANTLFNLGIVEWQGKMDIDKATAIWQKLLDTNPNYEAKTRFSN
jgi:tetratricopeptide (TPR) repeat protein